MQNNIIRRRMKAFLMQKKQADHLTDIFLKESAASYQEISIKEKEGNTSLLLHNISLLPVWTVRYDYRDSEYTFLMNGQTGKVAAIRRSRYQNWQSALDSLQPFCLFFFAYLLLC